MYVNNTQIPSSDLLMVLSIGKKHGKEEQNPKFLCTRGDIGCTIIAIKFHVLARV